MLHRRVLLLLVAFVTALAGAVTVSTGLAAPQDELEAANRHFADHSYQPALDSYRKVLADPGRATEDRGHATVQIGRCLRRLKKYDDAIAWLGEKRPALAGSVWEARLVGLKGSIYLTMPHFYYKKGDLISREGWIQGSTYHYTFYDDLIGALRNLEEAVRLLEPMVQRAAGMDAAERNRRVNDYTRACLGMAAALEAHRKQKGGLSAFDVHPAVKADYEKHGIGRHGGTDPQRWFRRAEAVARRHDAVETAATARYLEAMYCRRLLEGLRVVEARHEDGRWTVRCRVGGTDADPDIRDLPPAMSPFRVFAGLLEDYPESGVVDDAIYAFATLCDETASFSKALDLLEGFADRFPKSRWRSDVAALIQDITYPRITIENPLPALPGSSVELTVQTRNVREVTLRAFEVDLGEALRSSRYLRDADTSLGDLQRLVKEIDVPRRAEPAVELLRATADAGEHRPHTMKVAFEAPAPGAYLVEVESGETAFRSLFLVSKLSIIRKVSGRRTIVYLSDAISGRPVSEAEVLVRQKHRASGIFGRYDKITFDRGRTDEDGTYVRPHATGSTSSWLQIDAVAQWGKHYALTPSGRGHFASDPRRGFAVYGFTDRPVYRPGDEINVVGNLRGRMGTDYDNVPGEVFGVRIRDPKGTDIFNQELKADEFGVVAAAITVGDEPPLGVYQVQYRKDGRYIGRHAFRVEEYKKPEFEVLVEGPNEQVRAGDDVTVTVRGEYYSGGGVPGAKVSYRIFRKSFHPRFALREPYSWLYGSTRRPWWPTRSDRELVRQGEGATDDAGRLELSIDTAAFAKKYPDRDHVFEIEADVTDLSRRTISGSGQVIAPRRGLFVHLDAQRGFYRAGERAEIEISCQTPDGSPQKSRGRIVVYRVTATREGEEIVYHRDQIHTEPAETDAGGRGFFTWQADSAGQFVVSYVTEDRWSEPVVGERVLWVHAPGYRATDFHFKNLELISDKREYEPGETAYVMLNARFDDSSVFLTVEADDRILQHEVIRMSGKTQVLAIDIPEDYAPNVFVHAMSARNGLFFEASRELFVPPTHRFLDVDLAFDKPEYLPGEPAVLRLAARGPDGKPASAQFAVRVMDKAITYIQSDDTADIRRFFYGSRRRFFGTSGWRRNTVNSLQFRFQGYQAHNRPWTDHRSHGMPPGWEFTLGEHLVRDGGPLLDLSSGWLADEDDEVAEGSESRDDYGAVAGRAGGKKLAREGLMRESARRMAPPASAAAPAAAGESEPAGELAEPDVRSNFADLATWDARVRTDAQGKAELRFRLPDSLTTWVATARGLTRETLVGRAEAEVRATKRLLARLQAPRFFTERDEIVLSGVIRNDYADELDVKVELSVEGGAVHLAEAGSRAITIGPRSEARVDWLVRVEDSGEARVLLKALATRESDAVSMTFPVLSYGIDKVVTKTGVLQADSAAAELAVDLPAERRLASSTLELTLSPSLAGTLLEALPYLVEYPYGCTEQTMSRFLPAVYVSRTLDGMGIDLEDIRRRRHELDGERLGHTAPVYSQAELRSIVKAGLRRLASMQNGDGGFGWWRSDRSSFNMTAYVVYGLAQARAADFTVNGSMLDRAADWLEREAPESRSLPDRAYAAFALATAGRKPARLLADAFARRDELATLGKAQLALALRAAGEAERARLVVKNLEDFVVEDEEAGTCHWSGGAEWWRWYHDEVETNAYMLLAISEIAPESRYAQPLMRWLVYSRSGNRWKSTRDTAASVLALARFMRATGELKPDYDVVVRYAGREVYRRRVTAESMFTFDNRVVLRGDALETGTHPLVVTKEGSGTLYLTSRLTYFSKEDRITAAGHQVEVRRQYFALAPHEVAEKRGDREVKVLKYERTLLEDLASVPSGQEIEVKLTVTAGNNYEYVVLEDRKPAGFEPVELRSGFRYGNGLCSNMELRDEKVVFFLTWLQQGTHEITYRMRAEIPGTLHAMPCRTFAMYAPRLGGISDSWKVEVTDSTR